jgi:hypothetical protein
MYIKWMILRFPVLKLHLVGDLFKANAVHQKSSEGSPGIASGFRAREGDIEIGCVGRNPRIALGVAASRAARTHPAG